MHFLFYGIFGAGFRLLVPKASGVLLLLLLLSTSAALAQERVSGHVYSQKAGTPLAGVLVQLKGGGRQQLQMLRAHTS
ncbi:hypothetical protein ADICEAN_02254 [Cesiribacter andamanensis AMV16]|uniref:Carboxypeptidase regulatory-like domain-containing protein n=1 Tax=Cesiribacter andamanensis AMV16 TaxID=1279009 RepID=M7N1N2_9BACT|nr:hypothetical protein ADICEAN_02254 [Cesiribacter andamanensis AMV16]